MRFRAAGPADVPAVVALLRDDDLGAGRESADMATYREAFARIEASGSTVLVVGEEAGRVIATYQVSMLPGLSRQGASRALLEGVRVASDRRGRGSARG